MKIVCFGRGPYEPYSANAMKLQDGSCNIDAFDPARMALGA